VKLASVTAAALAVALAACNGGKTSGSANIAASERSTPGAEVYAGISAITSVAGDQVTIDHGPIEGIGWPAMTMTFRVDDPELVKGVRTGDRVSFSFAQSRAGSTLTSIAKS
jgi:membrane fusion protein, copper/silver efflux system